MSPGVTPSWRPPTARCTPTSIGVGWWGEIVPRLCIGSHKGRPSGLEEAASILEAAAGIDPEDGRDTESAPGGEGDPEEGEGQGENAETPPVPTSVDQEPPDTASRRLADQWREAREAMERWREAARDPDADPFRTAQLQREAQEQQQEALRTARQEASWQANRTEAEREAERQLLERGREEAQTPADRMREAAERMDRALARMHRDDQNPDLPGAETVSARTMSLPLGPGMSEEHHDKVLQALREVLTHYAA